MKDPYSVLGVGKDATDEEIKNAYRELARKYHPDNYDDDNPLKELATEKMQEVNAAYEEIQVMRASGATGGSDSGFGGNNAGGSYGSAGFGGGNNGDRGSSSGGVYVEIRKCITNHKFADAEKMLASVHKNDRCAEWHYLASVLLMKRGNSADAMRELEIACSMDPSNVEYQKAKEMFNTSSQGFGSTYYGSTNSRPVNSSADDACNCCANLVCLDCLCECMGGDLLRCI